MDEITLRTRQFARKQRTWYRKFDEVRWVDTPPAGALAAFAERLAPELGLT